MDFKEIEKSIYKMAEAKITYSKEFEEFMEIINEEIEGLKKDLREQENGDKKSYKIEG